MKSTNKKKWRSFHFLFLITSLLLLILVTTFYFYVHSRLPDTFQKNTTEISNKLVITRAEDKIDHLSALTITIKNVVEVKKLYDDIYLLPTFVPGGKYNCPMMMGNAKYALNFYHDNKLIDRAIYNPNGCASITLDNSAARIVLTSFVTDFQQATGLSRKNVIGHR